VVLVDVLELDVELVELEVDDDVLGTLDAVVTVAPGTELVSDPSGGRVPSLSPPPPHAASSTALNTIRDERHLTAPILPLPSVATAVTG
jgi:hypothetical protein